LHQQLRDKLRAGCGAQRPGGQRRVERWIFQVALGRVSLGVYPNGKENPAQRCMLGGSLRVGSQRVVIVADFRCSVQDYVAQFARLVFPRPDACLCCGQSGSLVGHGFYVRKALDQECVFQVRIKRWRCKACRRTTSVLPSFLLRFRHYLLAVISQALVARFELGGSWLEAFKYVAVDGLPSPRTIGRWCQSFAEHAVIWWAAVTVLLAQVAAASPALDPLGSTAGPHNAPSAVLHAALDLLAWIKTQVPEMTGYGLKDRLPALWHWGHGQGLGRLV